jgi:thymidylate kinase
MQISKREFVSALTLGPQSDLPFGQFLISLLGALDAEGVKPCVLRNYEGFPDDNAGRDVDFLALPSQLPSVIRALGLVQGARIIGFTERSYAAYFFLAGVSPASGKHTLQVDFDLSLTWKGLPFLSTDAVLQAAIPRHAGNSTFFSPSPVHEAIISLLMSLLVAGFIKEKYFPKVQRTFASERPEVITALSPQFGLSTATRLVDAVIGGDRRKILGCVRPLRASLLLRSLLRRPLSSMVEIRQHYLSGFLAHFSLKKLETVCILGPDGCGKTTIVKALMPLLESSAGVVEQRYPRPWSPLPLKSLGTDKTDNCPAVGTSGPVVSAAKLALWLLEEWISQFKGRAHLTLRIFESRYHDLSINPNRYGYGGPMWFARFVGKFFPSPDLWILLDLPAQEIQSRNPQLTLAEAQRQVDAYRAFARTSKKCVILDASKPVANVTEEAYAAVIEMLAQRTDRQLRSRYQQPQRRTES